MTDSTPRSRVFWAGWISAAVLLVVAAVAAVYAANLRIQLEDVELRLVDAVTKLQLSEERLVGAAQESTAIRANLALLSAPDVVDLKLAGKGTATEASGRVFVSRTKGLLFSAIKLPALADGRTYQVWWLSHAAPASVGVVQPTTDGNVTAVFDPLADAEPPSGFSVTVEPEAGSKAPTGSVVLATP
jgi:hypothetical protein